MKRLTLLILTCLILSGFNSSRGEDASPGPTHERWKSCAELFHAKGSAAVSDLQAQLSRPANIRELLQNLQLAWKQDQLLQPSFYEPATLRTLFAGSAVSWQEPSHPLTADVGYVVAQLYSGVLPGVSVRAESRCWRTEHKSASGHVESTAYLVSYLTLSGKAFPGMDLRAIRAVFGQEMVNEIDSGDVDFGIVHAPVGKGRVAYADRAREKDEVLPQRITFFFNGGPPRPPQQPQESFTKIVDQDVVRSIEMSASRHLQMEK